MRLIITRPVAQAAAWTAALRAAGVDAHALPLIGIEPPTDPAPLAAAWAAIENTDWVMFVSANAVERFFAARPPEARWPAHLRAGAPGPGTQAALRAAGVTALDLPGPADATAGRYDSEALWQQVADRDWRGRRVLVVRGEDGRDWLADRLRAAGAVVGFVAAYRRAAPRPGAAEQALLQVAQAAPAQHIWHFSSSEAVRHLQALAPGADWRAGLALASHARIAEAARAVGFGRVRLVPPAADEAASVLAIQAAIEAAIRAR